MMDDLISRQAAIDLAKDLCVPTKDGSIYRHRCIDPDAIRELPSVQPERKRGKWVDDGKGLYKCSECGELWTHWWAVIVPPERMYKMMRFCPNCGAEMRKERKMNDDLISRQAAIDALGEEPMVWTEDNDYALGERNQWQIDKLAIETVPSAQATTADVVEVVRCRDCKHCELIEKDSDVRYCYCHHMFHFEDYYCADGKRKETKDE